MKLDQISEAYIGMVVEALAPSEVAKLKADVKRTGKTHAQLADEHEKYANHLENIGQKSLAVNSRMQAAQHKELASVKEMTEADELNEANKFNPALFDKHSTADLGDMASDWYKEVHNVRPSHIMKLGVDRKVTLNTLKDLHDREAKMNR